MNLLRGVGRLLLGGFFIANGVKAVRDPGQFSAAAQPLADRIVPFARRVLPTEAAGFIPEDTTTLVRLNGVASVLGGLGMATGISSRGGGTLAAVSMLPHVMAANPRGATPGEREALKSLFLRNLALLGAAVVVSQDTRGRPSLLWRAADNRQRLAREASRAKAALAREAGHATQLVGKDVKRLKREAQLQARAARRSIEGALS